MKIASLVAVLALLGFTADAARLNQKMFKSTLAEKDDDETQFNKFVSKFQRSYRSKGEYGKRLDNFRRNKKIVDQENEKGQYELELNKFADLSNEEFQTMMGLIVPEEAENKAESIVEGVEDVLAESTADTINWVTKGAVQAVRNQASCGSCYAFSALGTVESALYIKSKVTVNLSEQQAVDCSGSFGNQGCNGGWMNYVFKYAQGTAIATEAAYPYTAKKGTCKKVTGSYKVKSYTDLTNKSPSAMITALAKGPVAIALSAGSSVFQLYKSGVLNSSSCGTTLNHAVIMVGYGTDGSTPYWLVRNSWGTSWGEKGYIKIYRDTKTGAGVCALLSKSSYPTV